MFCEIHNRLGYRGSGAMKMVVALCIAGVAIAAGAALVLAQVDGPNPTPSTESPNNMVCQPDGFSGQQAGGLPNLITLCGASDSTAGSHCYASPPTYTTGSTCGGYLQGIYCPTGATAPAWTFKEGVCGWSSIPGTDEPIPACGRPITTRTSPVLMWDCSG
jgi:hypothetical protein